jgi:hypothetical protein
VTNASITPLTSSTTTSPTATVIASRPAAASACPRGSRPGSTQAQPSRSPAPAATNTAVSSRIPCGLISPKNTSALPLPIISPPVSPTLTAFCSRIQMEPISVMPSTRVPAATRALFVQTRKAKDWAGFSE